MRLKGFEKENVKIRQNFGYLNVDGKITLIYILRAQGC
jgi:hypothetical protein